MLPIKITSVASMTQSLPKLHFSRKTKWVAFAIVAILLFSFFVFQPGFIGMKSRGLIESAQIINSSVWNQVAANAWAYFQPGVGVDAKTGLPYAGGTDFKAFTGWDLGVYIQAVIGAQKLGLINANGAWGSNARLEKILTFLETRPLNTTTNYPFWFYDATTGGDYHSLSDTTSQIVDIVDTGRLFVALNNLKTYNSSLSQRIDDIVLYGKSNYTALVPSIKADNTSKNIYGYYFISGYASFWPQQLNNVTNEILNNIENSKTITTYNVSLPDATIGCEPLLCSLFELNNTNSTLTRLMSQVYLAHQAYYNATGQYVAFSEGNGFSGKFVYEWVVAPDGKPWEITGINNQAYSGKAVIFNKVAFGFLALYNSTYAQNTVIYLEKALPAPTHGYSEGADNNGHLVSSKSTNTNGLIMEAALYAIQKN